MDIVTLTKILDEVEEHANFMPNLFMAIPSFTGELVLALMNKLGSIGGTKFLEIGAFQGATITAASYNNQHPESRFISIDNFSQAEQLSSESDTCRESVKNLQQLCGFEFREGDCWSKEVIDSIPNDINVYWYDGPHTEEDQYNAIVKYKDKLVEDCLILVDDYNWNCVKAGTINGIRDAKLKVKMHHELKARIEEGTTDADRLGWWNGIGLFIIGK